MVAQNQYTTTCPMTSTNTHVQLTQRSKQKKKLFLDTRWNWGDSSAVKIIDCSSKGPEFSSYHPNSSSKLCLAPVPGNVTPSHRYTCRQNLNEHKIKVNVRKSKPGIVALVFNSNTWEARGRPGQHSEFQTSHHYIVTSCFNINNVNKRNSWKTIYFLMKPQ